MPVLVVAAAVAAAVVATRRGMDHPADARRPAGRSSTIAIDPVDGAVWLTSPDDDQVVVFDPDLTIRTRVPVAGHPEQVAITEAGVLVTATGDRHLRVLARATGRVAGVVSLPCGSSRSVVELPGTSSMPLAAVSCPTDRRVVLVDLHDLEVVASLTIEGRPSALAATDDRLVVATDDGWLATYRTEAIEDAVARSRPAAEPRAMALAVAPTRSMVWRDGERSVSQLSALDATPAGDVIGTYQLVDPRHVPTALERAGDAYGSVHAGRARIEPAIAGRCGARFADFTQPAGRVSGPAAVAAAPDRRDAVWVVGQYTGTVALVRCGRRPPDRSTIEATWSVGVGARGIAVTDDGATAYVDVGFDHAVVRIDPDAGADGRSDGPVLSPTVRAERRVDSNLSAEAEAGRRAFHDATDPHLTPFGIVTCASCHPAGGDDGLTWRLETDRIRAKLRRTPPLWGFDPSIKPLHWDGAFADFGDLVELTVAELQGGDGLDVDPDTLAAYLRSLDPPPPAPSAVADEGRAGAVERGASLFAGADAGCSRCHQGESGTDGAGHDPLAPSVDPLGTMAEVVTPTLWAVRDRTSLGHDGTASGVADLLDRLDHGGADGLSAADRADLEAYLRTR